MDMMPMIDIPQLSMDMSMGRLHQNIGVAMLDMSLESAKSQGGAIDDLMRSAMELSVNPDIGSNFDMSA